MVEKKRESHGEEKQQLNINWDNLGIWRDGRLEA